MTKPDLHVPVLIVGGGPAGLTASIQLSKLGVQSLLVSRYAETSRVPKAHIINQRTMEILTDLGVAPQVLEQGTPLANMKGLAWVTGLTGPHDGYGRRFAYAEGWGGAHTDPDYIAASPCATANLPQLRLEPILKAAAEQYAEATVRFHHELIDLVPDADGVTATVLNRDTDERYRVRCSYLLGTDGGRTVGNLVGTNLNGATNIRRMLSVHMTVDLSDYLHDSDVMFWWLSNPDTGDTFGSGVLVPMGPDHWGGDSEEWTFNVACDFDEPDPTNPEAVLKRLRAATGITDLNPKIHHIAEWVMERLLADEFRAGRVFLLGDAAHRHTPAGALGMNSAVQDAYNLCWKLAAVLAGRAGDALLGTYEDERRPVDAANIEAAIAASTNHPTLDNAFGMSPDNTPEENWANLRPLWEELPNSAERRHAVNEGIATQTLEFRQHGVDYGYTYTSAAVVDDDSPVPTLLDPVRLYQASTRPGHPLPHAWVERGGERLALGSLTHSGHFALIAGEEGHAWVDAAEKLAAERGIPMRTARVGLTNVDLIDMHFAWLKNREISASGAVLVRPDGFIGFRALGTVDDPRTALASALSQILATDAQ